MRLKFTEDAGKCHKFYIDFWMKDRIISSINIRTSKKRWRFPEEETVIVFCLFGNDGGDRYENTRLLQWKIW